jgi:asparagine synthase (glutamine-hydrolysing)
MCGIAGFVGHSTLDAEARDELLDRMCRVIEHRGPDDQGTMLGDGVALGMRRLSIIDLAGGHQPMSSDDGAVTVVFNGEIYNFRELRGELEARGIRFRTESDTEAIVRSYEQFGVECVARLRGMFAFALWDARSKTLFVARDRVGKKPLYYTVSPNGEFVFGSELKSVVEHPDVRRDVDPRAIDAYLTLGYVPEPLSAFCDIQKLPPGCYLVLEDGEVSVTQYWDFRFEEPDERSESEYVEELRALIDEAVRIRLVSDVPLGAFLSGGVDSSTVVGLMARHTDRPVKTFSIGFNEDSYNELKYARVAAKAFNTEHHEFIVTPEICNVVDKLVWQFDEPFADSSAIPTYMVSELAREHVKVVLTGDGGDEVFAGYTRYAVDRRRSGFAYLPGAVRAGILRPLSYRLPHGTLGRNFIHNIALDPVDRYLDSASVFTTMHKRDLYTEDFRSFVQPDGVPARVRELASRVGTGDALDRLLYIDAKTYLPGDILTKVDRMSMAVSLEARAPLLDHKLIEAAARIPAALKMKRLDTKYILKRAVRGSVPDEILNRPKQGFMVPIQEWINKELRARIHDTLTSERARQRGVLEPRYVEVLLDEHERGRRDHAGRLWALFMLESWWSAFVDDVSKGGRARTYVASHHSR